jgi:uncharacterized membrane protein
MHPLMLHVPWNELHPLVVHFPVALLLIAPLFVLLGASQANARGRTLLFAALVLMCLGTAGAFAARFSGSAAVHTAMQSADAHRVLEHHEELAEVTSIVFAVLTVAFAVTLWTIWYRNLSHSHLLQKLVPLVFLVFYGAGILLLMDTAHLGGRLTHEFGVNVKGPVRTRVVATLPEPDYDKD